MEDISIFQNKDVKPTDEELAEKLGTNHKLWTRIYKLVLTKYPAGQAEWNYPGKKFGWSFKIKDKKRAIIYLLPRDRYFKVAFVFGDHAVNEIMKSKISDNIKTEIRKAKKYAEGRGIRIEVKDGSVLADIEQLIDIKLNN